VAREKRFRTSFMGGFKKSDVNAYIERILKEFDEKLKSKDDEISVLRNQNKNLKFRYDELLKKSDEINETRAKIGDVLIQAQEKAEKMLEEAQLEAIEERKRLEETLEQEREKLVDIRTDIKNLKVEIVNLLNKYDEQLSELVKEENEAEADEATGAAEAEASEEAAAAAEQESGSGEGSGYPKSAYDMGYTRY
jgi:chromosome segregation ATPase